MSTHSAGAPLQSAFMPPPPPPPPPPPLPLPPPLSSSIPPIRFAHCPITVLGAGVSGLTCGICLREAGYPVTIIADKQSPDTTSDRAGACFTPYGAPTNTRMLGWISVSFRRFCTLAQSPGSAQTGISLATFRHYGIAGQEEFPWWEGAVNQGLSRGEGIERLQDVARDSKGAYAHGWRGLLPRMDIPTYIPWLRSRFVDELGGRIETRRVVSFVDLIKEGWRIIVNCTGLGARELCHDSAMFPMRGQVLRVANTIGLSECLAEAGRGATGAYLFAFPEAIVAGGTYEKGIAEAVFEQDEGERIMSRCQALLLNAGYSPAQADGLAKAPRLKAWAGIRPCRRVDLPGGVVGGVDDEAVRLEVEWMNEGRAIVHNYGHGRSGITLSWGCAEEVVRLVGTVTA